MLFMVFVECCENNDVVDSLILLAGAVEHPCYKGRPPVTTGD